MALKYAKGEIFAFIDDDAYPRADWLRNAVWFFDDPEVGAVGGSAVTALGDNVWQQASGKVYESFLCSVGYDSNYYPGEDTKLCLDIVQLGRILRSGSNILKSGKICRHWIWCPMMHI